jgi:tryptophan-rich sensory protein
MGARSANEAARDGPTRSFLGLAGWLLITATAAASGVLTPPGSWYQGLQKPPFTPPDWLFPVAWTLLYVMMAVAAWLVWRRTGLRNGLPALLPYVAQLGANGLWSVVFFGWHLPGVALLDLFLLWVLILLTIWRFRVVTRSAALLLMPYLAWVTFAAYLNAGVWWLN